jgi:hypothetical protein
LKEQPSLPLQPRRKSAATPAPARNIQNQPSLQQVGVQFVSHGECCWVELVVALNKSVLDWKLWVCKLYLARGLVSHTKMSWEKPFHAKCWNWWPRCTCSGIIYLPISPFSAAVDYYCTMYCNNSVIIVLTTLSRSGDDHQPCSVVHSFTKARLNGSSGRFEASAASGGVGDYVREVKVPEDTLPTFSWLAG